MTALISPLSIAPMIDWTYTHFRVLMRLIAPQALLYTEMQTTGAVQNNQQRALLFDPMEHPLALQLGGADPVALAVCAKIAEDSGYQEVNLNLGCPSDRVQSGRFGACMMREASQAADCIAAMKKVVSIPVTAKTRIGIDQQDSYEFFTGFAHSLIEAGCDKLIVHARKAWLQGLNPKQNRTIPPINYDYVYKIKQSLTDVPVVINGDISEMDAIKQHMNRVDGVMLGRLACQNPYALAYIHHYFYPQSVIASRSTIMQNYLRYMHSQIVKGIPLSLLLKPMLNIAFGLAGSKRWKEQLVQAQQSKRIEKVEQAVLELGELEKTVA